MKTVQRAIIICVCIFLFGCTMTKTSHHTVDITVYKNRLAPCPKTPNCVSSIDPMDEHYGHITSIGILVYI
jgi:uncharacterized protein (DUF1499 family)